MRNTKAKYLRNKVYGDYSHKVRNYIRNSKGMILNTGKRKEYLEAKRKK